MTTQAKQPIVKQVIVVRKDLKMRRGKEIAQGSHASMKWLVERTTGDAVYYFTAEEREWLDEKFTKVCLRVESEQELMDIYQKCLDAKLTVSLITDAGATEFHGVPTKTCLAIGPHISTKIDPITQDLELY
jgi:PTH2 family peptidyl-tRNA hydrolase